MIFSDFLIIIAISSFKKKIERKPLDFAMNFARDGFRLVINVIKRLADQFHRFWIPRNMGLASTWAGHACKFANLTMKYWVVNKTNGNQPAGRTSVDHMIIMYYMPAVN